MYDYIIIGQGLAGTVLSYQLIKQGKKVLVLNTYDPGCSSYRAAGIFSPIAGQRIAKIWRCDEVMPYVHSFYPELEQVLQTKFFYSIPYIKILIDPSLEDHADTRLRNPDYQALMSVTLYQQHKALHIANAGYVDITTLLDRYRDFLKARNAYQDDLFDEKLLELHDKYITYKNVSAKSLIFCNGLEAGNNRFFDHLQFNPTKGELLTIKMDAPSNIIMSAHVFILPTKDGLFQVGATYERDYKTTIPSAEGKQWLIHELNKIITEPYEIIDHRAGIRPTTFGHRPFTQWHKTHSNIGIFSGFGSKGVSLIPFMTHEFLKN